MLINELNINNEKYLPPILGRIKSISGNIISAYLPSSCVGDVCYIETLSKEFIKTQVVSFDENLVKVSVLGNQDDIFPNAIIKNTRKKLTIPFNGQQGNLIIDALGNNLRRKNSTDIFNIPLIKDAPSALKRKNISSVLETGISAIDGICSIGKGQRIGLFAPPGVGKSTLLGMICKNSHADINIVALVGERGREVNDFLENTLKDGIKNTILVVSTSDDNSMLRATAPLTATAIAEHFREQGKDVLLMVDSLTRYARAKREIGLSAGEMPIRQGYPPSLYIDLAKLVERAGNSDKGSITAIYTILENDEKDIDPLAEEVKSLLDGHIVLRKKIAENGIRPAISILDSTSRLIDKIHDTEYLKVISKVIQIISVLTREKDLLLLGANASAELKKALSLEKELNSILNQGINEKRSFAETKKRLNSITNRWD